MVLMPKRVKYRKSHRGRRMGKSIAGSKVSFGEFGLQAILGKQLGARMPPKRRTWSLEASGLPVG